MKKNWLIIGGLAVIIIVAAIFLIPSQKASEQHKFATVVKLSGLAWFDRMEKGTLRFGEETGNETFLLGPPKADAALQVQIVEDLIAQKVSSIAIVPFAPEALEPVLQRAMDQGIAVISHEASNINNVNYDVEAFDNAAYGAHFMDQLAELMGAKGEYAVMVGSLTSKSHNEFIDAAIARQQEVYPDMKLVAERVESYDDQKIAYERAKELLKAYPNLGGFIGCAMTDPVGIGLAIEEMGLQDKTAVVGTSLVSVAGAYLETGAIDAISFWDPADVGYVMNAIAARILAGEAIADGDNLGVPGYEQITLNGKVITGQAWIDVTKENMDQYDF